MRALIPALRRALTEDCGRFVSAPGRSAAPAAARDRGAAEVRVLLARARACLSLTRDEEDEAKGKDEGREGVVLLDWNAEGKCYSPPKPAA
jgi:hypothetical protein